jgi:hypothetical protein
MKRDTKLSKRKHNSQGKELSTKNMGKSSQGKRYLKEDYSN